jgi:hypothetical protein
MALTVACVTHSGVLLGFAGRRLPTGPWFADGAAPRRAAGVYPGRLAGTGRGAGQPRPLGPPVAARPNPRPALAGAGGIFGGAGALHGAPAAS